MPGIRPDTKLDWQSIDYQSFAGSTKNLWNNYLKAREQLAEFEAKTVLPVRQKLEAALTAEMRHKDLLDETQDTRFAYRFGGIAVAVIDKAMAGPDGNAKGAALRLGAEEPVVTRASRTQR